MKAELTETDLHYLRQGLQGVIPHAGNHDSFESLKAKLSKAQELAEQYVAIFLIDEEIGPTEEKKAS